MEYYPDTRQGYQQICCRMARAISRGVELLTRAAAGRPGTCWPGPGKRWTG